MKINDVIIKEINWNDPFGRGAAIRQSQQDAAASQMGKAYADAAAASQKGPAALAKWPTTDAEIRAFQKANNLKVDGLIGSKTMAALNKAGVKAPPDFKPVGSKAKSTTPSADAKANSETPANNTSSAYAPTVSDRAADPNVAGVAKTADTPQASTAVDPSVAAGQNLAYLGQLQKQKDATADFQKLAGITPTVNNQSSSYTQTSPKELPPGLAGAITPQGSAENPPGQAAQPRDASTVPDAAKGVQTTPNVNPDTGLDATPKKVAGTSNVTSGSDDEMAWRSKNPNWQYLPPNQQYPGPGNWDPKTGRSKQAQAQADANADAVKGFLNKINPFAKKQQDAGPTGNVNNQSSGYTQQESAEMEILRKLSGL